MTKHRIDLDCDKIADLYLSGKSAVEIGTIFGVSQDPILLRLKESGIEIRGGHEKKDLIGKRFGRLVVLHLAEKRRGNRITWLCQCDCGNLISVQATSLVSEYARSCGCLRSEMVSQTNKDRAIDMTGQRFGRWLVLSRVPKQSGDNAYWTCKCACGTVRSVQGAPLRSGQSRSCGCISAEINAEQCGTKSPNWNSNLTEEERRKKRNYSEYREWRKAVFERDGYVCQKCGERGRRLRAHHIESYDVNKDLRTALENGITLCVDCHDNFHHIYGCGNNTREQFEEFLKSRGGEKVKQNGPWS